MVTETAKAKPLLITLFLVEASAFRRHTTMGMFEVCLWGSLGMLLLRSWIPSRRNVELDGSDFPMLRQMLFHAPLPQKLCQPKQGLRKKVPAGVCASAVREAQTGCRQSIPLRLRPWKQKIIEGDA